MDLLSVLRRWWSDQAYTEQHQALTPEEWAVLARDAGVSEQALRGLIAQGSQADAELPRLLRALSLDPQTIRRRHPEVLREMSIICSTCRTKRECRHHLEQGTAGQQFEHYCPNAQTMATLENERWQRRGESLSRLVNG